MDVITNGTVASIEHSLLVAQPGTQVHFRGAIDAVVGVLPYGFATVGEDTQNEWTYGDPLARPRAAHRAAEHVAAHARPVTATAIAQA